MQLRVADTKVSLIANIKGLNSNMHAKFHSIWFTFKEDMPILRRNQGSVNKVLYYILSQVQNFIKHACLGLTK